MQALGERAHEGFGLRVNFGRRARSESGIDRRAQRRLAIGEDESAFVLGDAALEPLPCVEVQQLHRHRVEHFIADDHTAQFIGQGIDPLHALAERRQPRALLRAQAAGKIDDRVAAHALPQRAEQLRRQRAAAGAELPELVGARRVERLLHLIRQRRAEQRAHLGRGGEVAARRAAAEDRVAACVVAQARRIQGQGHEAVERQPAAVAGDLPADQRR